MRLILVLLAVAQNRWAFADLCRADLLARQSDEAFYLAERRMIYAKKLAERARAMG